MEYKFLIKIATVSLLIILTGAVLLAYFTGVAGGREAGDTAVEETEETVSAEKAETKKDDFSEFESVEEKEEFVTASNNLNLLLSSVDHDLKMLVLDDDGKLVSGRSFTTVVEGPEEEFECEDFDKDGVIYASDLVSGEYGVRLFNDNGVQVGDEVRVRVREEISFTPLVNIEAEVYTEDEIDVEAEDTEVFEEAEEETEPFSQEQVNIGNGSIGIDVSKYNKDINWEDVRASGIEFAIIRIGYRGSSSGVLVVDPYFMKNLQGAKAAGMKIGVYFFTQAVNVTEAVEEASAVTTLVSKEDLQLPVFMDVESSGGRADGVDAGTRTEIINAFCRTLENAGYRAGVYLNKRWYETKIDSAALGDWKLWLARYKASEPGIRCDCWQYTSKGSVDGVIGNVDLDINYGL